MVSDVLKGERKKPQRWPWVACYVLTCVRHAATQPGQPVRDEKAVLRQWSDKWQALFGDIPPVGLDASGGKAAVELSPLWEDNVASPAELPTIEREIFDRWGQHGVALYRAATLHQDGDAAYRLGVLAYLDGRRPDANAWLTQAADEENQDAAELLDAPNPGRLAVKHATRLGSEAAGQAEMFVAWLFLKRAANFGDPEAEFQLGEICHELGHKDKARQWFRLAADHGHDLAIERLRQDAREAARNGKALPGPASPDGADRWSERLDGDHPANSVPEWPAW
ncbi:hypothetical protein [Actinomadura sp. 6N118]|uniref:hypothetical protein n=1 Tax=Actinomadura sp. 6N118 TaxID=3375151 RepID=UPI0037947801